MSSKNVVFPFLSYNEPLSNSIFNNITSYSALTRINNFNLQLKWKVSVCIFSLIYYLSIIDPLSPAIEMGNFLQQFQYSTPTIRLQINDSFWFEELWTLRELFRFIVNFLTNQIIQMPVTTSGHSLWKKKK